MNYKVINETRGEVVGIFGLNQFEIAKQLADTLAEDCQYQERFVVEETITVYETELRSAE